MHPAPPRARARHRIGAVQEHAPLCLVMERSQALDSLAVAIEISAVWQAQHHTMLAHARLGALPVRGEDVPPVHVVVSEETIGCSSFRPTPASPWNARRRLLRQSLCQQNRARVQPLVAQVNALECLRHPAHAYLHFVARSACYRGSFELCVMG